MPYKGNPDAKRIKSSDHIADLKRQISELQRRLDDAIAIQQELAKRPK
jgi:hypothetical protein